MDHDGFPFCFFYRPLLLFLVVASHFDTIQTPQMSMKLSQSRMVWSLPVHFLRKLHGRQEGQTAMVFDEFLHVFVFLNNNCLGLEMMSKNDGKDILFLWFWRGTYNKLWYGWRKSSAMILSWLKQSMQVLKSAVSTAEIIALFTCFHFHPYQVVNTNKPWIT